MGAKLNLSTDLENLGFRREGHRAGATMAGPLLCSCLLAKLAASCLERRALAASAMLRDAVLRNAALQNSRPRVVHPQEYLDAHYVPFYLNDVTTLLLRIRPAAPLDFIASYFSEVLNGTHVLLREFAYVSACPHNRWSFVRVVQESFAGVSPAHHELSAVDLLQQRGQTRPLAVPEFGS